MKFLYFLFIVFLFKLNFYGLGNNRNIFRPAPTDTVYMVVGLLEKEQSTISYLKSQFETVNNCKVLIFCKTLNVFIITFNNTENQDINYLFNQLKATNNYNLYLKEGSLKEILNNCYLMEEEITPEIKTLFGK